MQKTIEYIAKGFLQNYIKENNIEDICLLFDKETLIEHTYDSDWELAVRDEMIFDDCTEKEAIERVFKQYMSMDNYELFYEKTSMYHQNDLITNKAEDLGFEFVN